MAAVIHCPYTDNEQTDEWDICILPPGHGGDHDMAHFKRGSTQQPANTLGLTDQQVQALTDRFYPLPTFEQLRHPVPRIRPSWDQTWLRIACVMADRAECTRARVGAVVVSRNRSTWVGYNGAPSGQTHCTDGGCPRGALTEQQCPPRSSYGNCVALHAEMNAVILAGEGARGATVYLTREPCDWCRKMLRAAGVVRVVWLVDDDRFEEGAP